MRRAVGRVLVEPWNVGDALDAVFEWIIGLDYMFKLRGQRVDRDYVIG